MSGYGGIGRRAGFRFQWATVQVQILLSALEDVDKLGILFICTTFICDFFIKCTIW